MIAHTSTFRNLALAPVKTTDVQVARQIQDPYGYYDDTLVWASSDVLMSAQIDSVGSFLGTATKKVVVKLLGIVDDAVVDDIFQVRLGLYNSSTLAFEYISEGFYIVSSISFDYEAGSTSLTMYDYMWKAQETSYADTQVSYGLTYPLTITSLANQIASAMGAEIMSGFSSLPNASYSILVDPYTNISNATLQTVIGEIAQATGTTARMSNTTLVFSHDGSGI